MIRARGLPEGWYPRTEDGVRAACARWSGESRDARFIAAVVPHAGWAFSGSIAYRTLSGLDARTATVVVAGGHLAPGADVHIAPEDGFQTPLGVLPCNTDLRDYLRDRLSGVADTRTDNTVEVQLSLVHFLFPGADVVGLRVPPDESAERAGKALAAYAAERRATIRVVGSTDLTHYGPAYRFAPAGDGDDAQAWARDVNDRRFVDAMLALDTDLMLRLAASERSACSAGGAATAIAFAREAGAGRASLVAYGQSCDTRPDDSFVGYAGIGIGR